MCQIKNDKPVKSTRPSFIETKKVMKILVQLKIIKIQIKIKKTRHKTDLF